MFKQKTVKSINKRFKMTSRGKLLRHRAGRSHLLEKKSAKSKRKLRKVNIINFCDRRALKRSLPYL